MNQSSVSYSVCFSKLSVCVSVPDLFFSEYYESKIMHTAFVSRENWRHWEGWGASRLGWSSEWRICVLQHSFVVHGAF